MVEYDGIVIGAGPNGLALAAYLAKAGLKILVLEKRFEMGGGLATERVTLPDFLHDTHAIYHMMVEYAPPIRDLGLEEEFDLRWIYPELQVVMPFKDGSCLAIYSDIERTCKSIEQFSAKDARSFKEFAQWCEECTDLFLAPATYVNPLPSLEQAAYLMNNDITRRLDELTGETPKQIVDGLFEDKRVRAVFLYLATMWGLDYDTEGLGYLVPLMISRAWHFRLCKGGSHHLAHVLSKVIYKHGGMILTCQNVRRIVVEDGTAKGVELQDRTVINAKKFVCSSLNPHQTFLELVGEENLERDFVIRVKEWRYSDWSLFSVHMALKEPPAFEVSKRDPNLNNGLIYILGYESEDDIVRHFSAIKNGELTGGGITFCIPSLHDRTRAPSGRHVALVQQEAPFNLKALGGPEAWYTVRRQHAELCKEVIKSYAPNIDQTKILWDYISTPLDIQNKFEDMRQGCFKQGAYLPLQMGHFRPNEYCSSHFTPIKNLYICGSSSHSGGMITFGPAYCAAEKIAEDLGIDKWWTEPDSVRKAREAGLLG